MHRVSQPLFKELGAAFAVLAIYVLTLLVPLHQAAATQRGFAELGYETIGAWSICTAINQAGGDIDTPTALNCPVTGVSKQDVFAAASIPSLTQAPTIADTVVYAHASQAPPASRPVFSAYPRAPPALV